MFAQKAKLTGVYNDQYMTWVNGQGHEIGHALFENGLYHLDAGEALNPFKSGEVVAATVNFDDPVWKWHRRLGHLGFQNMLNLLDSSMGMEITAAQTKDNLRRFKFGLSAHSGHVLPPLALRMSGTGNTKYHEAKKEELNSHVEKGTWSVVPLPEGVRPVTSRWVTTLE